MKRKYMILILGILVCIGLGVGGKYYLKKTDMQSRTIGRESVKVSLKEKFNLKKGLENLTITLNVNNVKCKDDLKLMIKKPNGDVVDNFKVEKNSKKKYNKKFKGMKGQWTVDFIGKKDNVNYNYSLDWYGDNK